MLQDSRFGWKTLRDVSLLDGTLRTGVDTVMRIRTTMNRGNPVAVAIVQPSDRLMPFAAAPGSAVDSLLKGPSYARTELSTD
jgi:hypothetical protein